MAVERWVGGYPQKIDRESGQSVLEFLFMLPLMIGLTVMMLKVNSAIQVSIVNQQYARSQALFLAFNSAAYPRLGLQVTQMAAKGINQMVIGVSENPAPPPGQTYYPVASVQNISRQKNAGSDAPKEEPGSRSKVRVRTTVTLCTQPNVINVGGNYVPLLPIETASIGAGDRESFVAKGPSNLTDGARFEFCRGATL